MIAQKQPGSFRVATWNVERPKPRGWKIPPRQIAMMSSVDVDVWVLTETHVDHCPSDGMRGVFSPPHPERRPAHERWVAVWSRLPVEPLSWMPAHRRGSVAAAVNAPWGPFFVYGTVIAWANEKQMDDGRPARMWEVHQAEIERQGNEWRLLRERQPEVPLIVLGDFNQDRDGSGWYGTKAGRQRLSDALDCAGMRCITDADYVALGSVSTHLVDHVCVSESLVDRCRISCADPFDGEGVRLSDHPLVVVDIE